MIIFFEVGKISKQWTGVMKEAFTDADNFGVNFPVDLDVKVKSKQLTGGISCTRTHFRLRPHLWLLFSSLTSCTLRRMIEQKDIGGIQYIKLLDISTTIQNDQNVQIIVKSFVKIYLQDNSTKLCCIIMTFRLEAAR